MPLNRILLLLVCCLICVTGRGYGRDPEYASIYDGKSLSGWTGDTRYWRIEEGAITGEIPAGSTLVFVIDILGIDAAPQA